MDINYFKKKLEEEKMNLEQKLSKIAVRNPQNPEDWETKQENLNTMPSDQSEMADAVEEFGEMMALENELEQRFNDIKEALKRIEEGKYGICEAEGCHIEKDRLEADPAAPTCIKHADHI